MTNLPKPDVTVTVRGTNAGGLYEILECRIFEKQGRFLRYSLRGEVLCLHRGDPAALALPFPLEPGEQTATFLAAWLVNAEMPPCYSEAEQEEVAAGRAVPGWCLVWTVESIEISRIWVSKR